MASQISSLGLGSSVLTADVIDKLKANDVAGSVTPLDTKITLNKQKQDANTLLTSLMKTLKTNSANMADDLIFTNKKVDISGTLGATITKGANVESFSLETTTLAKKDITKLGALSDKTTPIASGAGVLKINDFEIAYSDTTTLEELTQAITDKAGASVSASILKTGEGAFNLIISSKETGVAQALTISDSDGSGGAGFLNSALFNAYDETTNPTGYKKTQEASDASFKYNGITTTRSTNNITDLVYGLNLTLKKEGDTSNVTITDDFSGFTDEIQSFVDNYNKLTTNLSDSTTTNKEKGTAGIFSSDTFIKSISRDLNRTIMTTNSSGESLVNYGITIDKTGKMVFDKSILDEKLSDNSAAVKLFFSGGINSSGSAVDGIFDSFNTKLGSYTASGKNLSNFETSLKTEATNLTKNRTAAQASLDARYETMTKKFAAYDALISKINSQFSSLQMMIDAAANSDN
jgi:flagellar hook-associated protein 2